VGHPDGGLEDWREELIQYGLEQLTADCSNLAD
jgi:hypothetical protein